MTIDDQYLLHGAPLAWEPPMTLDAGPLSLQFEYGVLRYIRLGGVEALRQIYSAVRDHNWGTVPGVLSNLIVTQHDDRFEVTFDCAHQQGEVHFVWRGAITGDADGTLRYHMAGEALSTFRRNRIGFCVLHPMQCAGAACRILHTDGTQTDARFPVAIAPHQPFFDIRAVQHEYAPNCWLEVRMEGDTFEMEDQRNWIDASFKTYCTPLALPFPVTVPAGTRIEQTITLTPLTPPPSAATSADAPLALRPMPTERTLPPLGLGAASHDEPLSPRQIERLKALGLAHLRVDVRFDQPYWQDQLARRAAEAASLGAALEVALHLSDPAEEQLAAVAQLGLPARVARWLIFRVGEKSTREPWLALARQHLGADAALVTGTDAFFTELNRERPPHHAADGVVYSLNPQVHAFDDASLVETLAVHATTLETARTFCGGKPIYVGPVTFKMRWNPNATAPEPPTAPDELPRQADPRQMSLFGAGWALGSLKYLALAGAAGTTHFETTGYMGIMATEAGSRLPDQFPNVAGGVYPMYHVFADLAGFTGAQVIDLRSSDPLRVDGWGVRQAERERYLIANYTGAPQDVTLALSGRFAERMLCLETALAAMREPEAFRASQPLAIVSAADALAITLPPFAVLTLDRIP
ncbi:MAG: hypothetical protein SNJ83_00845 [Aggregatilineales bacterium]